jgi:ubiquinone/menaquinone biosynthesis C-methylase UbiE
MKRYLKMVELLLSREPDPAYKRRAKLIFDNLEIKKGDEKILEIGCGRGFYINNLGRLLPKAKITGIDLNEKYLEEARKNQPANVSTLMADATKLPFKDQSFDRIIASEILEHIPDDKKAVSEMARVLKTGGVAVITVPNKNYPFLWDPANWSLEKVFRVHLPANIWWLSGIWAGHQRLYEEKELDRLIDNRLVVIRRWQATHYCLPFSHFWFYAIGKNLVEKGWLPNFNRFSDNKRPSLLNRIILAPVRIVDRWNQGDKNYKSSVNLIYLIRKRGETKEA